MLNCLQNLYHFGKYIHIYVKFLVWLNDWQGYINPSTPSALLVYIYILQGGTQKGSGDLW